MRSMFTGDAPRTRDREAKSVLLGETAEPEVPEAGNWRECFPEIIGRGPAMAQVLETVAKVARTETSVLILGESGTGKDLVASAIHRLSRRSDKPFVPINSSAIPESLLESELFGHERGAFTGADKKRVGYFELAQNGTIFLDEIGDMPFSLQAKLLRVLQDRRYTPLGGTQTKEADARIIAATNKDLEKEVQRKSFREDLFYRLNVLPIRLPALRERKADVPQLLEYFTDAANRMHGISATCYFTDAAMRRLSTYSWPGNVRQLQNLVERLVVMKGGGPIDVGELPTDVFEETETSLPAGDEAESEPNPAVEIKSPTPQVQQPGPDRQPARYPENFGHLPSDGVDLCKMVEELENTYIRQALERTGNNKNKAAKLLGLNRTTLVERIKKRKITPLNDPSREL